MTSPAIIFNIEFRATEYYKGKLTKKMKDQQIDTKEMTDYYERPEAIEKTPIEAIDLKEGLSYYNFRQGSCGGFTRKGNKTYQEQIKGYEKHQPQIIWRMVYSFTPTFAAETGICDASEMKRLFQKMIESNIQTCGFDIDNVEYCCYYHTNTDHPHVHVAFYEKEPKKKFYKIPRHRMEDVKSKVLSTTERNIYLYTSVDQSRKELIDRFDELQFSDQLKELTLKSFYGCRKLASLKETKQISAKLHELEKVIPEKGSLKYNSKNIRPYHEQIKEIVDDILDMDCIVPFVKKYESWLDTELAMQVEMYGGSINDLNKQNYKKEKLEKIETQVANMVLSGIKAYRMDKQANRKQDYNDYDLGKKKIHGTTEWRSRTSTLTGRSCRALTQGIEDCYYATQSMERRMEQAQQYAQRADIKYRIS